MLFLVVLRVFIFLLAQWQIQCVEVSVLILIGDSFKLSSALWPQSGLGSCISAACGVNQTSQYRSRHAAALQHTRESSTCTGSIIGLLREALVSYWSTRLLHHSVLLPSRLLSFPASFPAHHEPPVRWRWFRKCIIKFVDTVYYVGLRTVHSGVCSLGLQTGSTEVEFHH